MLITFNTDGGAVATIWIPGTHSTRGVGHGEWIRTGDREFAISGSGLWIDMAEVRIR